MTEYIEKKKVINEIRYNNKVTHYSDDKCEDIVNKSTIEMQEVVFKIPAADVQPVRHGQWFECYTDSYHYSGICSVCGQASIKNLSESLYEYCPRCGARMNGGVDNAIM